MKQEVQIQGNFYSIDFGKTLFKKVGSDKIYVFLESLGDNMNFVYAAKDDIKNDFITNYSNIDASSIIELNGDIYSTSGEVEIKEDTEQQKNHIIKKGDYEKTSNEFNSELEGLLDSFSSSDIQDMLKELDDIEVEENNENNEIRSMELTEKIDDSNTRKSLSQLTEEEKRERLDELRNKRNTQKPKKKVGLPKKSNYSTSSNSLKTNLIPSPASKETVTKKERELLRGLLHLGVDCLLKKI